MLIIYKTNLKKYNNNVIFENTTSELHILKPGKWQDTRIPGGADSVFIHTRTKEHNGKYTALNLLLHWNAESTTYSLLG